MEIITRFTDIRSDRVDWVNLGLRFKKYREIRKIELEEAADKLKISSHALESLERSGDSRISINIIWQISRTWDLSLNWLLNGIGKPHDADPAELLPDTLVIQKGAGIRRSPERLNAEEGIYTDEVMEFVLAVDKFKRNSAAPYVPLTQIYEIILALGYRKSVPARIAPLGYVIEHQRTAEYLKQLDTVTNAWIEEISPDEEVRLRKRLSRVKYNKKRRTKRQEARQYDHLSESEKARREKISQRNHIAREGEKFRLFLLTDPQGCQYIPNVSLTEFCKQHGLMPAHMYSVAAGFRKQHKGWKAEILPKHAFEILEMQTGDINDDVPEDISN